MQGYYFVNKNNKLCRIALSFLTNVIIQPNTVYHRTMQDNKSKGEGGGSEKKNQKKSLRINLKTNRNQSQLESRLEFNW